MRYRKYEELTTCLFEEDEQNSKGKQYEARYNETRKEVWIFLPERASEDIREAFARFGQCSSYQRPT